MMDGLEALTQVWGTGAPTSLAGLAVCARVAASSAVGVVLNRVNTRTAAAHCSARACLPTPPTILVVEGKVDARASATV